jgi:plasmid stability protein
VTVTPEPTEPSPGSESFILDDREVPVYVEGDCEGILEAMRTGLPTWKLSGNEMVETGEVFSEAGRYVDGLTTSSLRVGGADPLAADFEFDIGIDAVSVTPETASGSTVALRAAFDDVFDLGVVSQYFVWAPTTCVDPGVWEQYRTEVLPATIVRERAHRTEVIRAVSETNERWNARTVEKSGATEAEARTALAATVEAEIVAEAEALASRLGTAATTSPEYEGEPTGDDLPSLGALVHDTRRFRCVRTYRVEFLARRDLTPGEDTCGHTADDEHWTLAARGELDVDPESANALGTVDYTASYTLDSFHRVHGCKTGETRYEGEGTSEIRMNIDTEAGRGVGQYRIYGPGYAYSGEWRPFDCETGEPTGSRSQSKEHGGPIVDGVVDSAVDGCTKVISGSEETVDNCNALTRITWTLTPVEEAEPPERIDIVDLETEGHLAEGN